MGSNPYRYRYGFLGYIECDTSVENEVKTIKINVSKK
jgi:hypothetical protein